MALDQAAVEFSAGLGPRQHDDAFHAIADQRADFQR